MVTDGNGAVVGSIAAQGNNLQAGVGSLYSFNAVFTGSLNVPSAGPVTFTFTSDDGFVFGVGGGATRVSGPQLGTPGNTAFTAVPVMGGSNVRQAPAPQAITVNFPAAGSYPYELDYAKGGDSKLTLTMTVGGMPVPAATLLTLTPVAPASIPAGQAQTFTLAAKDGKGAVIAGVPVSLLVSGVNPQTQQLTTDGTGQAVFAYAASPLQTGIDTLQGSIVVGGATAYSNVVKVPWNNAGVNAAPQVSAGTAQTITMPGVAVLTGSVSDDGLPSGALTVSWTKQSGPGVVTFDDASQASTAASFSAAGTYVLQLSASDGALTATSTVTITVNQNANWTSTRLLTPVDGTSVSGVVPVTLKPGVTLTSGTLTYYAAGNTAGAVVLNASTVGSGSIGNFDTTGLPNGAYFVELYSTDSQGVTLRDSALVNVVGDYKPGRVTATVTDLVVPAPGLPIKISRVYDSLNRGVSSDFGYGWRLETSVQISVSPVGDVTLTLNGKTRTFYFTPQANQIFSYWYTPSYTAEPGFYGSLATTGDNCNAVLQKQGHLWFCAVNNAGSMYSFSGLVYTDPYGRKYTMGADGSLQSVRDLNGNVLTIAASGISSTNGLSVPFVRDASGRITTITDPTGKVFTYGYNAAGELASVTLPPVTGVTAVPLAYTYAAGHLLNQEKDARGNTAGSSTYYADGKLQSVTDAAGNTTQYAYNTSTRTTTVTNPDTGVETTVTDAYGNVVSFTDGLNRTTSYTYDSRNNRVTETNPLGKTWTYTYDSNGFKTSSKDPLNNIVSATFNIAGGPTSVTNALNKTQNVTYNSVFNVDTISDSLGQIAKFTWNTAGLPLTMIDARGNTSSYGYDAHGNRTSYTDPLNRVTTSVYDSMGRKTSETDPRLNVTTWAYDALGRVSSMTNALNGVTSYTYDGNGNKLTETDPLGRVTSYQYDSLNRVLLVTFPDTKTKSYTYDFRGKVLTETDESGRVTKNVYDKAGQLTSVTRAFGTPDAGTMSYTYDGAGRKLTETDERSNVTTFTYDAAGRLTSVTNAQGKVTSYGYDAAGQRTSMTDANSHMTGYAFDARGRLTTTTLPDNKTQLRGYDALGIVTSTTDPDNRTTIFGYDKASQLISVTNALNQITSYGYDLAGNKTSQTDANNHVTTYEFDKLNRRTKRTLPNTFFETYSYDSVGNLKTRTNFNGKTTTYVYDARNRVTSITPDPSIGGPGISFTYTASGRRASMTDASGSTAWTYDNRDRVLTKAAPAGTLTYTWDAHGNVASVLSSNTGGVSIGYAWDSLNRLSSVTDNRLSSASSYTYDNVGNLATITYPNGVVHSFTYDLRDQPTSLQLTKTAAVLASYSQVFGFSGQKTSVTESARSVAYSYDAVYKLLSETITGGSVSGAISYTLDPVGNRLTRTSSVAGIPAQSFVYDAADRLTTDTYDNNGNTLSSGGNSYTYDFLDRLVTGPGVTMVYDGDGNRVSRTVSGVTTAFVVDDFTPTGYAQVAEEVVSGAVVRRYTHGLQRISQTAGPATSYYGYDGGMSVRQLFDGTGAVTDTFDYDAFGNLVASTGSTQNVYLYRGEQYEPALGFYYLRARWLNSLTGRFATADAYEGEEEQPRSLHLHTYANDDPINISDPSGQAGRIITGAELRAYGVVLLAWGAQRIGVLARGLNALGIDAKPRAEFLQSILIFTARRAETARTVAKAIFVEPETGNVIEGVAVSGNRWTSYLRSALTAAERRIRIPMVPGYDSTVDNLHHAEMILLEFARRNNLYVVAIGTGRGVCIPCNAAIRAFSLAQEAAAGFPVMIN